MDIFFLECIQFEIVELSVYLDNELYSCVAVVIFLIMVVLGKVIGKDFVLLLSRKCFVNLFDDIFMMVVC